MTSDTLPVALSTLTVLSPTTEKDPCQGQASDYCGPPVKPVT